ncbi:MAG: polyprenol monophosphomannose synthase [Chloroflexi bacterium]|nr:polyprenol monophosphomannose synthase [Chloroflexota bacterium]
MSTANQVLLSVVVPTYNERDNIERLVRTLLEVCAPTPTEVIVVDDGSPDGTAEAVVSMSAADPRVRLITRAGKQGLSSAVYAGAEAASGKYVCVIDADFSHNPEEVPQMLARAQQGYAVVIGSRYVRGSAFIDQPFARRAISYVLNLAARALLQISARDALTGFAIVEREVLLATPTRYSAGGFKWLVELLATQRGLRVAEWPIIFRDRTAGSSKASAKEAISFAVLCGRLLSWKVKGLTGRG